MLATEICGLETGFRQLGALKAADVVGLVARLIMGELIGLVAGQQGLLLFCLPDFYLDWVRR